MALAGSVSQHTSLRLLLAEPTWSFDGIVTHQNITPTTTGNGQNLVALAAPATIDVDVGGVVTDNETWPFQDVCVDQGNNVASLETAPPEIQLNILAHLVDPHDMVDVKLWIGKGDVPVFLNGVPPAFKNMRGIFGTNWHFRRISRDWMFKLVNFVAEEWEFHAFPTLVGHQNARAIRNLQLGVESSAIYDHNRPKLLDTLVRYLPRLERLTVTEEFSQFSSQFDKPAGVVGKRHKTMKLLCQLCYRHRGLTRIAVLPDMVTDLGFVTTYVVDKVAEHTYAPNWQTMFEESRLFGDRSEYMILNATVIRRLSDTKLSRTKFVDVSIQPGPGQSKAQITTSEVPNPASHYTVIDEAGFHVEHDLHDGRDAYDRWLSAVCESVDKQAYPIAYLMRQYARQQLQLLDMKRERDASEAMQAKLRAQLEDRNERLSKVHLRASQTLKPKHKMRQLRKRAADIAGIAKESSFDH